MSAETEKALETVREALTFDFHATQHIVGLQHDGHDLRAIHREDVDTIIEAFNAARPALSHLRSEINRLERSNLLGEALITKHIEQRDSAWAEIALLKRERNAYSIRVAELERELDRKS